MPHIHVDFYLPGSLSFLRHHFVHTVGEISLKLGIHGKLLKNKKYRSIRCILYLIDADPLVLYFSNERFGSHEGIGGVQRLKSR